MPLSSLAPLFLKTVRLFSSLNWRVSYWAMSCAMVLPPLVVSFADPPSPPKKMHPVVAKGASASMKRSACLDAMRKPPAAAEDRAAQRRGTKQRHAAPPGQGATVAQHNS